MAEIIEQIAKTTAWDKYSHNDLIFPSDSVVDAYNAGKEFGKQELKAERQQIFLDHANAIAEDVVELVSNLESINVSASLALLKLISINDFVILVAIKEKDYLSDKMYEVYNFCTQIEKRRDEKFSIRFTFVGDDGNLDFGEIKSDNFLLIHKLFNKNESNS